MNVARRTALVAVAVSFGLIAAPTVSAAPRVTFDVRPATPRLSSVITVTVAIARPQPGKTYRAFLDRRRFDQRVCKATSEPVTMRRLADGRFTATFRPGPQFGADSPPAKVWCPGPATVHVERIGPGKISTIGFAKRAIRFARAAGEPEPAPIPAHEASITVLPGSTITAWAPGRPDRSTPVSGALLGRYRNGADPFVTTNISGTLALPSLAADPLCPGSTPLTSVDVDSSSEMVFGLTGHHLTLVLRGQPVQLFGCGPAGGPAGTTSLTVSAPMNAPSNRLPMFGALGDLTLPGGSQGGITASLNVRYDVTKNWVP